MFYLYKNNNVKPYASHIIKSALNINTIRSCESKNVAASPLLINAASQFLANGFHNLSQYVADSIVAN